MAKPCHHIVRRTTGQTKLCKLELEMVSTFSLVKAYYEANQCTEPSGNRVCGGRNLILSFPHLIAFGLEDLGSLVFHAYWLVWEKQDGAEVPLYLCIWLAIDRVGLALPPLSGSSGSELRLSFRGCTREPTLFNAPTGSFRLTASQDRKNFGGNFCRSQLIIRQVSVMKSWLSTFGLSVILLCVV